MITFCDLLLMIAVLATLPLPSIIFSIRHLAGPDRATADLSYFFVCCPRWLSLAIVLNVLVARGEFAWLADTKFIAWVGVIGSHGWFGVFSLVLLAASTEKHRARLVRWRGLFLAVPIVLPLIVVLYAAILLHSDSPALTLRYLLVACAIVAWLAGVVMCIVLLAMRARRLNKEHAKALAAEDEQARQRLAEFETLPADVPLGELLEWSAFNEPEVVRQRALARIKAHPNLIDALATMLRDEWRGEALRYVKHELASEPPCSLAEPARDALLASAARVREKLAPVLYVREDDYDWECVEAIQVAHQFAACGVDFSGAIRAMLDGINASPNKQVALRGRRELLHWLERHGKT